MLFPRGLCSPDDARWHREAAVSARPGRVPRHSITGGGGTGTTGWDLVGVMVGTRLLWPKWGWDASPLLRWALLFGKRGGQGPGQRRASMHRERRCWWQDSWYPEGTGRSGRIQAAGQAGRSRQMNPMLLQLLRHPPSVPEQRMHLANPVCARPPQEGAL